jgi:hypothetical protein
MELKWVLKFFMVTHLCIRAPGAAVVIATWWLQAIHQDSAQLLLLACISWEIGYLTYKLDKKELK